MDVRTNVLAEIKEQIELRIKGESKYALKVGATREEMTLEALQELERERKIRTFLKVANMTRPDIEQGVDFFVIYVTTRYKVCRLNITGRVWAEFKKWQHPENQIIAIDLEETRESVKHKILRAIEARENNWTS